MRRHAVPIALFVLVFAASCKLPDSPPSALTLKQQIAALPTPSMLGVAQYSGKSIGKAIVPFSAGAETPAMSTGFFLDGIANGGMDSISAGLYAELVYLLKSLSDDQLASGSHSFVFQGGQTLDCSWSENGGKLRILSIVAGNFRDMIEISQDSGKIAATIVTKVLSSGWPVYYVARYDEASQSCEVFWVGYDYSSNVPNSANVLYVKNSKVSGANLIGLVQTSNGTAARTAAVYSDPSGTAALHGTDLEYYRPNGSPFLIIDANGDNYRVAEMTTYPANLAYDNAYDGVHWLFVDADGNQAFDAGTDTDIAGGVGYRLMPVTITSAGAVACDHSAERMRFLRVAPSASLPSGFSFDSALVSLKDSLDAKLQAQALPFADSLVGYDPAPLFALIAAEEAATFP